jgi:hypothetical protein
MDLLGKTSFDNKKISYTCTFKVTITNMERLCPVAVAMYLLYIELWAVAMYLLYIELWAVAMYLLYIELWAGLVRCWWDSEIWTLLEFLENRQPILPHSFQPRSRSRGRGGGEEGGGKRERGGGGGEIHHYRFVHEYSLWR